MQLIYPCNTIQVIPQDPNTCLFNTYNDDNNL
jgi:hypothetical protein